MATRASNGTTENKGPKRRSWNVRIPTTGGPVAYLNVFDAQEDIRIPETLIMGDGTYTYCYSSRNYRWREWSRASGGQDLD